MSSKQGHHGRGFPVLAAVLIVAGIFLLLHNFNVLPSGIWRSIKNFWPVLLLILGVNIFLRDRPWLAGFIVLMLLLATAGAAWWVSFHYPGGFTVGSGLGLA